MVSAISDPPRRISDFVSLQAARNPTAEALVLGPQRWSYQELAQRVDALASALIGAGVRKGDRVATLQTPHPEFMVCFLATASIGAIWVGLNPKFQLEELKHAVVDAQPRVLISRLHVGKRSYLAEIEALRKSCASLEHVVTFEGEEPQPNVTSMGDFLRLGSAVTAAGLRQIREGCGDRDPCLIVYTSGSTGKPKGALLHHEGICKFSVTQNALWPVNPLRVVNYFPINHIGCTLDVGIPTLAAGGTIVFMEQFDPTECLSLMSREKITLWASVPSVFAMQLALPDFQNHDLSALQLILWEGASMPLQTLRELRSLLPRLATNYGMTEATSAITALEPTDDEDALANSVGSAFPGVDIRLADAQDRQVPDGEEGQVLVRSSQNMLGYWRNSEATQAAFTADGFFRTGDLAVRRPDGRYRLVGRLKEMFKSGGYNVYPREVEAAIECHPAVDRAVVVGTPDPVWQEAGVAFLVSKQPVTTADLRAWCASRLANYKVPKRFIVLDDLPLLPIGKVDRAELRRRAATL